MAQPDTLKPVWKPQPAFEPIFGNSCAGDTLTETLFTKKETFCRLVRQSLILERIEGTKTVWKTSLNKTPDGVRLWNPCLILFEKKWIVVQASNVEDTAEYTIWIHAKNGKISKKKSKFTNKQTD